MEYNLIFSIIFLLFGGFTIFRGRVENKILLLLILGFPISQFLIGNGFEEMWPHLTTFALAIIAGIIIFFATGGIGAGVLKLAMVLLLWLPALLILETVIVILATGVFFGFLSALKIKIGDLYLKHYAGFMSWIAAYIVYVNGITDFI